MHTWLAGTWLNAIKSINSIPRITLFSIQVLCLSKTMARRSACPTPFVSQWNVKTMVQRWAAKPATKPWVGKNGSDTTAWMCTVSLPPVFSIHLRKKGCNRAFPAKHKCLCVSVAWCFRCMSASEKQQKPRILKHNLDPNRASSVLCSQLQCTNLHELHELHSKGETGWNPWTCIFMWQCVGKDTITIKSLPICPMPTRIHIFYNFTDVFFHIKNSQILI